MTRARRTDTEALTLTVPCPLCGRQAGWWCVTIWTRDPGAWATSLHRERGELAATDGTLPITIPGGRP